MNASEAEKGRWKVVTQRHWNVPLVTGAPELQPQSMGWGWGV